MNMGDALAWWLVGNYVLVGLAYGWAGDWWRVCYWAGAILIVTATVMMK
jgi:hypothetical protein